MPAIRRPHPAASVCLSAVLAMACTAAATAQTTATVNTSPGSGSTNGIAVVVNGRPILKSEIEERYRIQAMMVQRSIADPDEVARQLADLRRQTEDALIEEQLILKEFEPFEANFRDRIDAYTDEQIRLFIKNNFDGDRERFLRELTRSGLTYKKFREGQRRMVIVRTMRAQFAKVDEYITSDERAACLAKYADDFREPGQIKLWSITIPGYSTEPGTTRDSQRALAEDIRRKLVNGADFATMARTYSQDTRAANGGDWGFITRNELSSVIASTVFALPEKKISNVLEVQGDFFIFWVEAKKPGAMKPEAEVNREVEARIMMEKRKKANDEWIAKLKRKATIHRYR